MLGGFADNLISENDLVEQGWEVHYTPAQGKCVMTTEGRHVPLTQRHGLHCLTLVPVQKTMQRVDVTTRSKATHAPTAVPLPVGQQKVTVRSAKDSAKPTQAEMPEPLPPEPPPIARGGGCQTPAAVVKVPKMLPSAAAMALLIKLHFALGHPNFRRLVNHLKHHDMHGLMHETDMKLFAMNIKEMCTFCGLAKHERTAMRPSLGKEVPMMFPGERVSVDCLGKFVHGIGGVCHAWMFLDHATDYQHFHPCTKKSAYMACLQQFRIDTGLARGAAMTGPIRMISDAGSEVLSKLVQADHRANGVTALVAPTDRQEWNGRLEGKWGQARMERAP